MVHSKKPVGLQMHDGGDLGIDRLSWQVVQKHDYACFAVGIVMKPLLFALGAVFSFGGLGSQQHAWQPSPGHTQVAIWPGVAPDAQPIAGSEVTALDSESPVAGKPWTYVGKVSRPTMTVYSPKGRNTGAAVVVFPGGGYQILAMDLEGTEVCDWLTSKGITCVLLKYRVPGEGLFPKSGPYPNSPLALEAAQRTVGLVRFRAAELLPTRTDHHFAR
jgi:hypothetical protein